MQTYCYTLSPLSAFGTPLAGDTLFGQLCWTLRHQLGNARLDELLLGYTRGKPFLVVSDALPAGHVPLPNVPSGIGNVRITASPDVNSSGACFNSVSRLALFRRNASYLSGNTVTSVLCCDSRANLSMWVQTLSACP